MRLNQPLTTKKMILKNHQFKSSVTANEQRALTAVGSVGETATRCQRFKSTCEFTLVRNHTSAHCVGNSSHRKVNSKVIIKSTRVKSRSPAQTAARALPTLAPWTDTDSRTRGRDPITAPCATGASTSPAAWGSTRKSTSVRSLTVPNATKVSLGPRA